MRKHSHARPVRGQSRSASELNSHIDTTVTQRPIETLKPFPGNARRHPRAQVATLAHNMRKFGITQPVLVDEQGTILCGHGRVEGAKLAGIRAVPTLTIRGLSFAEKRALNIADNRIGEQSNWDFGLLRKQFVEILSSGVDIELTGFSTGEVDLTIDGHDPGTDRTDPDDDHSELVSKLPPVSQLGDLWLLGRHRLLCGNALLETSYQALLAGQKAQMVVTDVPYNVKIQGYAMGRGRIKHREFVMASGEMSPAKYTAFLRASVTQFAQFSIDGSIHYIFIDWRHQRELFDAADPIYAEQKTCLSSMT